MEQRSPGIRIGIIDVVGSSSRGKSMLKEVLTLAGFAAAIMPDFMPIKSVFDFEGHDDPCWMSYSMKKDPRKVRRDARVKIRNAAMSMYASKASMHADLKYLKKRARYYGK